MTLVATDHGELACADAEGRLVYRVGYEPEPWAWTPWQFADDGRFIGRWDDPDGRWRSLYVGQIQPDGIRVHHDSPRRNSLRSSAPPGRA